MADTNAVVVSGRLTRDPEVRQVGEQSVANFSIAHESYGQKDTAFYDIAAWGKQGDLIGAYKKKGHSVTVTGRLRQETYTDKNGDTRKAIKIVATDVQFHGKGSEGGDSSEGQSGGNDKYGGAPF